jgi:hypothetical protein
VIVQQPERPSPRPHGRAQNDPLAHPRHIVHSSADAGLEEVVGRALKRGGVQDAVVLHLGDAESVFFLFSIVGFVGFLGRGFCV